MNNHRGWSVIIGVSFENALPMLRSPLAALREPTVHHVTLPVDPDPDLPLVAFTCDGVLLDRELVAASGIANAALYQRAIANLANQRGSWRVEAMRGRGVMGAGKEYPQVMSLVHPLAAEHVLIAGFLDDLRKMMPEARVYIPVRGRARCATPEHAATERRTARRAFVQAGRQALCPLELHASPIAGQPFMAGARFVDRVTARPGPIPIPH